MTHLFKVTWIREQLKHREFGSVLFVCLYVGRGYSLNQSQPMLMKL